MVVFYEDGGAVDYNHSDRCVFRMKNNIKVFKGADCCNIKAFDSDS